VVFSSVTFLFFFLPAVLGAYYLVPRRARNAVLVLASLAFYTWGAGWIVVVLIASIALNSVFGLSVERAMDSGRERRARAVLALAVVMNVALLAWFKYANFTVETLNGVMGAVGADALPWADILLPIGISFYTFHSLSYLVDIYRGTARHLVHPVDFALYITFFPQLIAGPIVRFHEIRDQLVERTETSAAFTAGVYRFCHGLGKKVLIADTDFGRVFNATETLFDGDVEFRKVRFPGDDPMEGALFAKAPTLVDTMLPRPPRVKQAEPEEAPDGGSDEEDDPGAGGG